MYKLITSIFLIIAISLSCQEPKPIATKMPDTKPPLLLIEKGLNPALKEEKVVFEKYTQTRMWNAEGNRLYANGDLYVIYLGSNESLKKDAISWEKLGAISQKGLNKMQKIARNSVVDYINDGPHKVVAQATSNTDWYFYFDQPIFVESQLRQWTRSPKFVRQMDKAMEQNTTYQYELE